MYDEDNGLPFSGVRVVRAYWLTLDDGVVHNIIDRQFKESTIEDMNYDPDLRTYCIEWGARVRSSETLKGVSTSDSSFWNNLTQTAKEGILLTLGFGYPANTPAELGVSSADDAIAATQVLLWEFELGYRTDYEKHTTESILFDGRASTHEEFGEDACGIDGTAAESAYYAILAKAKAYKAKANYSYTDLESSTKFLLWEGTDASQEDVHQVIACYLTPWKDLGEPWDEFGSIEVYKKDANGNNLSGAIFEATNTDTENVYDIGPTDSNGYAMVDQVPFGTYTVKEVQAPDGYRLSSETWTVTLDKNSTNGKVTINAVNTLQYVYGYATATKLLDGAAPGDARFTFTLKDSAGNTITTRENTSTGTFMFRDMNEFTYSMNDVGTHTYTITEEPKAGYSHDTHVLTVTHRVYMDNGTLKIDVTHSDGTTFSNTTYSPGIWDPTATKSMEGRELKANEFWFELRDENGNLLQSVQNKANGDIDFASITYTQADVGVKKYTIRERKENKSGVTYSDLIVNVTVTIVDNNDGTLSVTPVYDNTPEFKNVYNASSSWRPSVMKQLNGATLQAGQFTFELVGGKSGTVFETQTNMADGSVPFNGFNYTLDHVGTHTYIVRERKGSAGGYTYDEHEVVYTVTVSDAGDGTLKIEESHTGSTTFTNSYSASSSWKPSVTKQLNGATLQAGQFTFELVGGKSGTVFETQTNMADGSVPFNGFNYTLDHVGTHTYIVRERKGSAGGYTYDEHEVTYTVTVSDAGDGTLKIEESHTGSTTFTNSYNSMGIWDPTASKSMEGRELKANEFWFELRDENGNLLQSVQNKANGDIDFASITYTQADVGVKKYTIRERKENKSGVTYSDLIVNVVVTIVDNNDGTLSVTPVYDNTPEFKNVYNASSSYTFEASKELVGGTLSEGQFTAVLSGNGKEYTAQNDANGKFTFETLNFTLADVGTKTYTLHELKGNDANIAYDSTVYSVILEISDNGDGTLKIVPSIANSALKFTNYIPMGEFTPEANKTLLGGTLSAGQFDFELLENGTVIDSTANAANGDISFKKLSYSLSDVGTKTYTIREVKGSDANIAYDGRTITVEVTISYSGSGDKLTVEYNYPDGNEFVNAIPTGTFAPVANKIFEDRSADGGRVLKDGEYQFILSENGAELQKVWNKADGSIPFDAINYTLADVGTHTYTITEVVGNEYCVVYDTHTLTITVTVEYDGGESLEVTAVYEGGQTFTNVYEPVDITVNKIWDDNNNQDGDRTDIIVFLSSDDGHEPRTGIILKGESSYTWKDLPKYLNDGTPIKYTVTEASVNDYDVPVIKTEDGYNFVITNTQIPETVDVNITKYWRDNKDAQGVRPEEITVVLLGSDGSRREATFSGTGDRWWYTFYGLPRFHDEGKEIIYTVSEVEINGYVMLTLIQDRVMENYAEGKWTWIYIDEFHRFFDEQRNPYAAEMFARMFSELRKFGAIITGITQLPLPVIQSKSGATMLANSSFVVSSELDAMNIEALSPLYALNDDHQRVLASPQIGQYILRTKGAPIQLRLFYPGRKVDDKNLMYDLFNTDFKDRAGDLT